MIKPGVDLSGLKPQMAIAYTIACEAYARYGGGPHTCVITSASDGKHSPNSLHYQGLALDLRTSNMSPALAQSVHKELKTMLGEQFDVVLEPDHIHLEFDVKELASKEV